MNNNYTLVLHCISVSALYLAICYAEVTESYIKNVTAIKPNQTSNEKIITFKCPEQFGYFSDSNDCSKYFVCVFGDALHESCTGGLYFSSELQTCDWPRNVHCIRDDSNDDQNEKIDTNNNNKEDYSYNNNNDDIFYDNNESFDDLIEDLNDDSDIETDKNNGNDEDSRSDNAFSEESDSNEQNDGNNITVHSDDQLDIQRQSKQSVNNNNNYIEGNVGRSANGVRTQSSSRFNDSEKSGETDGEEELFDFSAEHVKHMHNNKVNMDVDPQQPAYDEAVASVFDENGGIHVQDGPIASFHFTPSDKHVSDDSDSDSDVVVKRKPRVVIRRRMRVNSEEKNSDSSEENSGQSQYIPVLLMKRTDISDAPKENIRRLRSHNIIAEPISTTITTQPSLPSSAYQKQINEQTQHFDDYASLMASLPLTLHNGNASVARINGDNLEFRGFVATRDKDGRVIAIPIFKNFTDIFSTSGDNQSDDVRRKRVRVVQKLISRRPQKVDKKSRIAGETQNQMSTQSISTPKPQTKPSSVQRSPLPRILVPDFNQWHSHLPFYGPSLRQIKRVQILPPIGPLPVNTEVPKQLFKPTTSTLKPENNNYNQNLNTNKYVVERREMTANAEEVSERVDYSREISQPIIEFTSPHTGHNNNRLRNNRLPLDRIFRPKHINRQRKKTPQKQTSEMRVNFTETTKPIAITTTTVSAIDNTESPKEILQTSAPIQTEYANIYNVSPQPRLIETGVHEIQRIKLTRNGKRLGPRDNPAIYSQPTTESSQTDTNKRIQPIQSLPVETAIISNTRSGLLSNLDVYNLSHNYDDNQHYRTTLYDEGSESEYSKSDKNTENTTPISTTTTTTARSRKRQYNTNKKKSIKASSLAASRPQPLYATPTLLSPATKCVASKCRLPDCLCGGTAIPNGMSNTSVPQIVLITFDDSVNDLNWEIYEEIFSDRLNPNGCPILGTFYVSHEWTDYGMVQTLYSRGHEMASHSITHSFGERFSVSKWNKEVNGQREILHMYGGVHLSDVRGMRAPFLQGGGNKQFEMLYASNFTYDSSMPVFENSPPFWPYTLDYQIAHECMIAPCPSRSFPGVWEVGMVMWHDLVGGRCSMADACSNPSDEQGVRDMLIKNFNRHYHSNRAPFGLFYHSAWFNTQHHRKGFLQFIDELSHNEDVYFVTNWQLIQWLREPTPLSSIKSFTPWHCNYDHRPLPCTHPVVCNVGSKSGSRFFKTCQPCPKAYPWVGNTGFVPSPQTTTTNTTVT